MHFQFETHAKGEASSLEVQMTLQQASMRASGLHISIFGGVDFFHNVVEGRTNYLPPYPGSTVRFPLDLGRGVVER